ncbi:class I SAM-dependent methyltransferase [bacterium]|nr:class I SAM-dependent methyltransferase [FCB group bacterium]MBL7190677.1 class I SAM-dependent methyltransferase [bacterium]
MKSSTSKIALGKPSDKGDKILERRYNLAGKLSNILQSGGKLLDIGCGGGAQTEWFIDNFALTVGVDVRYEALKDSDADASFICAAGEYLPFADESFDAVISFEVLEHVEDPGMMMREIFRVLKAGGEAVITVPNKWWIFEIHGAYLPVLPWNRVPFFSWLPEKLHDKWAKARIYTQKKLTAAIKVGGFQNYHLYYITAPMDRAKPEFLKKLLQSSLFSAELARIPILATNILAVLKK